MTNPSLVRVLHEAIDSTDGTSYSFTVPSTPVPAAGHTIVVVLFSARGSSTVNPAPGTFEGLGLTWTQRLTFQAAYVRTSFYTAVVDGSLDMGDPIVAGSFSSTMTNVGLQVLEFADVDTTSPVVQTGTLNGAGTADPSFSMGATVDSGNTVVAAMAVNSTTPALVAGAGFTLAGTRQSAATTDMSAQAAVANPAVQTVAIGTNPDTTAPNKALAALELLGAASNVAPTVTVSSDTVSPVAGDVVTLTAAASDTDGTITSYDWTHDAPVGTVAVDGAEAVFTVPYARGEQVYTFTCEVTDDDGATDTDSELVTVPGHTRWVNHPTLGWRATVSQAAAPPPPATPTINLSVTPGNGQATLEWDIEPNGSNVDGSYEGRDGVSSTGGGPWESSTMTPGLTESRVFLNLVNDTEYNLYVVPVIDGVADYGAAVSIAVTPTAGGGSTPDVPAGYVLQADVPLTSDPGCTYKVGKTNNGGYNRADAVTYGPNGQTITASRRAAPITSGGYPLYFDTGDAMFTGTGLVLPNYFRTRAVWQVSAFHVGLWFALWFRPFGAGEGEIDKHEAFGGHLANSLFDHKVTVIKTPYGAGQVNYGQEFRYSLIGEDSQGITNEHTYELEKAPNVIRTWCDGVQTAELVRGGGPMSAAQWDGCFEVPSQRWYLRHTIQIGDDPDGAPSGEAGPVPAEFESATSTLRSLALFVPESP